jgi:hypothetical protein
MSTQGNNWIRQFGPVKFRSGTETERARQQWQERQGWEVSPDQISPDQLPRQIRPEFDDEETGGPDINDRDII